MVPHRNLTRLWLSLGLAFVLGFSGSGCSLLFVNGPKSEVDDDPQACTISDAFPVLDMVLTGLHVASIIYLMSQDSAALDKRGIDQGQAIALDLSTGGLFAVSSLVGFARTSDCRKATGRSYGPEVDEETESRQADRMRRWEQHQWRMRHTPVAKPVPTAPAPAPSDPGDKPK